MAYPRLWDDVLLKRTTRADSREVFLSREPAADYHTFDDTPAEARFKHFQGRRGYRLLHPRRRVPVAQFCREITTGDDAEQAWDDEKLVIAFDHDATLEELNQLAEIVPRLSTLKHLVFRYQSFDVEITLAVIEILQRQTRICALSLIQSRFTEDGWDKLIAYLCAPQSQITFLEISRSPRLEQGMQGIARVIESGKLKSFLMFDNPISQAACLELSRALTHKDNKNTSLRFTEEYDMLQLRYSSKPELPPQRYLVRFLTTCLKIDFLTLDLQSVHGSIADIAHFFGLDSKATSIFGALNQICILSIYINKSLGEFEIHEKFATELARRLSNEPHFNARRLLIIGCVFSRNMVELILRRTAVRYLYLGAAFEEHCKGYTKLLKSKFFDLAIILLAPFTLSNRGSSPFSNLPRSIVRILIETFLFPADLESLADAECLDD